MPGELILIPLFGIVFSMGIPGAIAIVWITLSHRSRQRLVELHHAERMAAIERGMDLPPLPLELIRGRSSRRRTSLLPGLVWTFVGLAVCGGVALAGVESDLPWIAGFIPLGVGLAYLVYYFMEGRKLEARLFEHELSAPSAGRSPPESGVSL